jgi:hypothetical protein
VSNRVPPDWMKTGTVAGYAKYLCQKSDALLVIVVRPNDAVLAADPALAPKDAGEALMDRLPELLEDLAAKRKAAQADAKKAAEPARLKWSEIG